jgi:hypothetical protein
VRLEPLAVWFQPAAGALLPQLRPFLLAAGQAQAGASARLLRWAITAAEPARGLRIEAVLVVGELGGDGPGAEVNPGSDALTGSGLGSQSCLDSLPGSDLGFGSVACRDSVMPAGPNSASAATLPTFWRC